MEHKGSSLRIKQAVFIAIAVGPMLSVMLYHYLLRPVWNFPILITLLILFATAVLFASEALPLSLTAMCIPIALYANGVISVGEAFSGLSNENVVLFGAMFIIGGALFRSGITHTLGGLVVRLSRGKKRRMIAYLVTAVALISSVMSNTGTVAVLMPVFISIADVAGWDRKHILMPLAMMASMGGMITLVGTPPNMTVNVVLEGFGHDGFGFLEFAWVGIPISIVGGVLLVLFYGRGKAAPHQAGAAFNAARMDRKQMLSLAVLGCVVIAMVTGVVNLTVAAVVGALACRLLGLLTAREAIEDIDWTTIFLFAGVLPLANALENTGAGQMIAQTAVRILGENPSEIAVLTVIFLIAVILTQFMSNTAACALLAPIGLEIALALQADPKGVLIATAVASSSAFCTPMATPPNTLIFGKANARFSDYVKIGLPLVVVSYVVCILVVPRVWPFFG